MNVVILAGALARDPETRSTQGGTSVCNLRVATKRRFEGKDGTLKTATDYHNCVAFGKTAEKLNGAAEGDAVEVVGSLQTRSWQDQSDAKRYTTEVVIGFDGRLTVHASARVADDGEAAPTHLADEAETELDDEIPF